MDDAWFAEVLINICLATSLSVVTIESKFLPKISSSVISDVLSNAAQRFLESWVSDDITGGIDVGVETTVVVGVGADETEVWTTAGTKTAESVLSLLTGSPCIFAKLTLCSLFSY